MSAEPARTYAEAAVALPVVARPALRVAAGPAAATVPPTRRDAAYVVFLAFVLTMGVLGVLLLNTAMQQQARLASHQQAQIAALAEQAQQLKVTVDREHNPALLARKARRLHLRPARRVLFLTPADLHVPGGVSARRQAAARGRAG